jgi:uncharacterized alpha-E superfamily protein
VANAIGSGVLQAPALMPFLPTLCRNLLGEELAMASIPTWWCGQRDALKYVLSNLKDLVVKPAFAIAGSQSVFGRAMTTIELEKLAARIEARPENFVGQEHADSYSVPVLDGDRVQPRRFVVRAYLAAADGSYTVMPGGLTRTSGSAESMVVSLQKGGGSKDTWIVSDGPVPEVTLLAAASLPVELSRGGGDLPSRVADDLFWLGRYVQRAESIVRLARCVFNRLTDPNALPAPGPMSLLVGQLVGRGSRTEAETPREFAADLFAAGDPAGLREAVRHVHSLARVLRDRISADAWQILREIETELGQFSSSITDDPIAQPLEMLNRLVAGFLAFSGMVADSMTRGQAFRFLDLGMRLERALALAHLVRATLVQVGDEERFTLDALLEIADSSLTYRRRYLTQLEVPAVIDLIFADETNPRSAAFCVAAIHEHLASLPRDAEHPQRSPEVQLAIKLRATIRLADLTAACRAAGGRREKLDRLAGDIIETLAGISSLLGHTFFSHASGDGRLLVRAEAGLS